MPSLNRPNAPDRLPSSDFGNLFGRPRAIRGSDLGSSSSHPSPLTTPGNNIAAQRRAFRTSEGSNAIPAATSPLASPSPFVTARPRPKGVARRSYHSDASAASPPESSNVASPSNELLFILGDESAPLRDRNASGIQITPSAGSEQPPRTPKSGFKWKREFAGPGFEIRIGRQAQSVEHSVRESGEITPVLSSHSSTIRLPLSNASTSSDLGAHDQSPNAGSHQPLLPESRDSSDYALLTPKEGLYCRTKRALGLKHDPLDPTTLSSRERTETDNLLERVSSTLRFLPDRKTTSQSSATSVSNLSIAGSRWQRIMSRRGRLGSTSSSIRGMMMGRPPLHTPEPEAMYTGSDSNTYVAVNLIEEGVAFLPSEARRVHTPPLPTGSTGAGKFRGFFFDYNAPLTPTSIFPERATVTAATATAVVDATNAHAHTRTGARPRRDSDWYRVKTDAIEAEGVVWEQLADAVPEHLPNSPLCPRNPKHKSGGVGECPYHGRNPSLPRDGEEGGSRKTSSPSEIWW